jgi:hypothetical protein
MREQQNVLILGGRAPVALDHARRFTHQGWSSYVADSVPCRLSGWSSAVARSIALPSPRRDARGFVAALGAAIERHRIDLVVPTCEEVFYLSRYRSALPAAVRVAVDDFDQLRALHSKWTFQELARDCGGNPPPSAAVHSLAEAREWARGAPLVLKPEFSRFGVHVRLYPHGVPARAPELASQGRWVAQHFLAGRELCSYSVAERGRLLAHAVYHPAHRLGKSASYYFRPVASAAIRAFVERLVAKIGFTGQIAFDWIEAADGTVGVIECNPRAVSGVHLFGPDDALPAALAGVATGCVLPTPSQPRTLAAVMLTAGLGQALRSGRVRDWWADLAAAGDVLAVPGDRLPALGALRDMASFARIALRDGGNLRQASTGDIEWDGQLLEPL